MTSLFINYRRDDAPGSAGRIHEHLSQQPDFENVFFDVDMEPGINFVSHIIRSVEASDVMVSIIGRNWLKAAGDGFERRLDNPEDFVRLEIETAYNASKVIIPVLVEGAKMPGAAELPVTLRHLVQIQALDVTNRHFARDISELVKSINSRIAAKREQEAAEAARRSADQKARLQAEIDARKERELAEDARRRTDEQMQAQLATLSKEQPTKADTPDAQGHISTPSGALVKTRYVFMRTRDPRRLRRLSRMRPGMVTATYRLHYFYRPPFLLFLAHFLAILLFALLCLTLNEL